MKSVYKQLSAVITACFLIITLAMPAFAQRGRVFLRGGIGFGSPRFGLSLGIGGPRFGFGYRPYYGYPGVGFYFNTLPYGYYPFYWGPDQYYYSGGTFYRPYNNGYQVAAPPMGAAVPEIPSNAHPIMIDGQQYYEMNGVYYKEGVDDKGKKVFIVTGKDGVLNTDATAAQQTPPARPEVGDVIDQLPYGSRKIKLSGKTYHIGPDGIYYEEFTDQDNNPKYRIASVPDDATPPQ